MVSLDKGDTRDSSREQSDLDSEEVQYTHKWDVHW